MRAGPKISAGEGRNETNDIKKAMGKYSYETKCVTNLPVVPESTKLWEHNQFLEAQI